MQSGSSAGCGTFKKLGNRRGRVVLLTAVSAVAGLMRLPSADAAVVTLSTTDTPGNSSFTSGTNWSNAAVPSSSNDYFVTTDRAIRTPITAGNQTFGGNSLTLGAGSNASYGILICKALDVSGDVITVNNLNLSSGVIEDGGNTNGTPISWTLASNNINVLAGGFAIDNGAVATRLTTISGPLSGSGGLIAGITQTVSINGGILYLTGNNSNWTGTELVSGGTMEVGNGGTTGTLGTGIVTDISTLAFNLSSGITIPNTINGTGSVVNSLGTTILTGTASNYSGATLINAGTLVMATPTALGNTSTITPLNGTTFDIATNGSDTAYAMNFGTGNSFTIASDLATAGAGINHTLGTLSTGGGTVSIVAGGNVSSGTPSITFNSVLLNAGSVQTTFFNPTTANAILGPVAVGLNGNLTKTLGLDGSSTGNFVTGNISNGTVTGGIVAFLKSNTSTWTLTGTNTYTGISTVTGGILNAASNSPLGSSTNASAGLVMSPASGTATVNFTTASPAIASLLSNNSGTSLVVLGNTTAGTPTVLTVGGNNASTTFGGVISDGTPTNANAIGSLIKTGTGVFTLTGSNTYTGNTNISAGTVAVGNGTTVGTLGSGSIINNGTLIFLHSNNISLGTGVSGTGGLVQAGPGTLTLTAANTFTGPTTVTNGSTLALASTGSIANTSGVNISSGAIFDISANPSFALNSTGVLSGTGNVNGNYIHSAGTLAPGGLGTVGTLTFNNNLALSGGTLAVDLNGNTSLTSDVVAVNGNLNLSSPTALSVNFLSAGTLNQTFPIINYSGSFSGSVSNLTVTSRSLTVTNTGSQIDVTISSGAAANLVWASTSSSNWDVVSSFNWLNGSTPNQFYQGDNVAFNDGSGLQANINVTTTVSPGSVTINSNSINYNFNGSGQISGLTGLNMLGSSVLTIYNANSYTGTTNVSNGTLAVVNTTGSAIGTGPLLVGTSGTVLVGNATAIGSIGSSTITDNGNLTFNRPDSVAFATNISGGGSVNQIGVGTLTLSGSGTYSGYTNISAGTLVVASSTNIGTSTIVFNGGTLSPSAGNGVNISNGLMVTSNGGTIATASAFTGALTGTGTLTLTGGGVVIGGDSSGFSGAIIGTNQVNLGIQGTGLVTNASTGITTAIDASANAAYTTNFANNTNGIILNNGGTYTVNMGSLSGVANSEVRGANSGTFGTITLSIGALGSSTFNGAIANNTGVGSNVVALTKVGLGTFNLTGQSYYSGPTNISSGILSLAGALNPSWGELNGNNVSGTAINVAGGGELLIAGTNNLIGFNNSNAILTIAAGGLATTADTITCHIGTLNLSGGTLASGLPNSIYGSWAFSNTPTVTVTANSTISALNLSGNTIFAISPATTLTLSGNYGYASNLSVTNGGTLLVTGNNAADTGTLAIAAGSTVLVGNATTVGVLPTGAISDSGTLTFAANNISGGLIARTIGALTINNGGVVTVARSSPRTTRSVITTSALSIAGGTGAWQGQLDVGNNDLDVQNGSLANLTNQVQQGFNGGNWQGTEGILSTVAASSSTHLLAIGVIQNSVDQNGGSALMSTFDGVTVANTDVLLKFTYYGDANLDGKVDGTDYSRIDSSYLTETTTATSISGWYNGDFNYDGVVDGSDYTLIDNAFNSQGAQILSVLASPSAITAAQIAGSGATSAVPEPASLGLLGIGAAGLLGRRRRR